MLASAVKPSVATKRNCGLRFFLALMLVCAWKWADDASAWQGVPSTPQATTLHAGFGEADITPKVGKKPVYLAGFGKGRAATGVHDPLMARAVVLKDKGTKIALVSVDVVGLF